MKRVFFGLVAASVFASCAHDQSLQGRMAEAESSAQEVNADLVEADKLLTAGQIDKAENYLVDARAKANDRQMVYYPDNENLQDRLSQAESRLNVAKDVRQKQEIAAKAAVQRENIEKSLSRLRGDVDSLQRRQELSRKLAKAARESADNAARLLEENKILESNAEYASYVKNARQRLAQLSAHVTLAESLVSFGEGPGARYVDAKVLLEKANSEKDDKARADFLVLAREKFQTCAKDADAMIAQSGTIGGEALFIQGKQISPKALIAECQAQTKAVDTLLNPPPAPTKQATKTTKKKKSKRKKKKAEAAAE